MQCEAISALPLSPAAALLNEAPDAWNPAVNDTLAEQGDLLRQRSDQSHEDSDGQSRSEESVCASSCVTPVAVYCTSPLGRSRKVLDTGDVVELPDQFLMPDESSPTANISTEGPIGDAPTGIVSATLQGSQGSSSTDPVDVWKSWSDGATSTDVVTPLAVKQDYAHHKVDFMRTHGDNHVFSQKPGPHGIESLVKMQDVIGAAHVDGQTVSSGDYPQITRQSLDIQDTQSEHLNKPSLLLEGAPGMSSKLCDEVPLPLFSQPQELGRAYQLLYEANNLHICNHSIASGEVLYKMACCLSLGASVLLESENASSAHNDVAQGLPPHLPHAMTHEIAEVRINLAVATLDAALLTGVAKNRSELLQAELLSDPNLQALQEHRPLQLSTAVQRAEACVSQTKSRCDPSLIPVPPCWQSVNNDCPDSNAFPERNPLQNVDCPHATGANSAPVISPGLSWGETKETANLQTAAASRDDLDERGQLAPVVCTVEFTKVAFPAEHSKQEAAAQEASVTSMFASPAENGASVTSIFASPAENVHIQQRMGEFEGCAATGNVPLLNKNPPVARQRQRALSLPPVHEEVLESDDDASRPAKLCRAACYASLSPRDLMGHSTSWHELSPFRRKAQPNAVKTTLTQCCSPASVEKRDLDSFRRIRKWCAHRTGLHHAFSKKHAYEHV